MEAHSSSLHSRGSHAKASELYFEISALGPLISPKTGLLPRFVRPVLHNAAVEELVLGVPSSAWRVIGLAGLCLTVRCLLTPGE